MVLNLRERKDKEIVDGILSRIDEGMDGYLEMKKVEVI